MEQERERWLEWVVEALVSKFPGQGSRIIMEMVGLVELKQTRFYQEVYQEGSQAGEVALVLRQLQRKVGSLSPERTKRIQALSLEQLESLGEALLDFATPTDLDQWLESFLA